MLQKELHAVALILGTVSSMKSIRSLAVCGALMFTACAGSDADTAPDDSPSGSDSNTTDTVGGVAGVNDEPATQPTLTEEELQDVCPDAETLSAAAGVEFSGTRGAESTTDDLGSDPSAGATTCGYEFLGAPRLIVTTHGSDIDTSVFESLPDDLVEVTELPSGALQVQFSGQTDCEVYGGRFSIIAFGDSDGFDSCAVATSVHAALTEG